MAKTPEVKTKNTKITGEGMSDEQKCDHILKALRAGCPRIVSVEVDFETLRVDIFVPPPANTDPRASLAQREFLAESGVTKVESATIEFICTVSLKAIVGGELVPTIRLAHPSQLDTVTA